MKKVVSTEFSTKSTFSRCERVVMSKVFSFSRIYRSDTRARGVVVDYYSAIIIIINRMI